MGRDENKELGKRVGREMKGLGKERKGWEEIEHCIPPLFVLCLKSRVGAYDTGIL